jgi:hypothetical protein
MKMNRALVLLTMGFALSLMLMAAVSGSTSVNQSFFFCNQGNWYQASGSGDVQINVCTGAYGSQGGNVQFQIKTNGVSVASGGCNPGPCSNPTAYGIEDSSYIILRFSPSSISGMQVMEPDSSGIIQQVWVPYQTSYQTNCDPYYQFCYTPQSQSYCGNFQSNSCSAVAFRIVTTPITINVFFTSPYS